VRPGDLRCTRLCVCMPAEGARVLLRLVTAPGQPVRVELATRTPAPIHLSHCGIYQDRECDCIAPPPTEAP
jgi:hypothetical protein